MIQARYQVFVSSTFRDLREERQSVLDAILEMTHFPAGMEMFPASNATPWAVIERVIRDSDFYVLIVGGMYGSTDTHGISYTEREYDYALEQGKPILAFLHKFPEKIPAGKSELKARARTKLNAFRKKVERHHCKYWSSTDELKYQVVIGLTSTISSSSAIGWVRADGVNNQELLVRWADLQSRFDQAVLENQKLRDEVDTLSVGFIDGLSSGSDGIEVEFEFFEGNGPRDCGAISMSWDEIFFGLARDLTVPITESLVRRKLGALVRESSALALKNVDRKKLSVVILDASIEVIKIQFLALEYIEITTVLRSSTTVGGRIRRTPEPRETPAWKLTRKGLRYLVKAVALR